MFRAVCPNKLNVRKYFVRTPKFGSPKLGGAASQTKISVRPALNVVPATLQPSGQYIRTCRADGSHPNIYLKREDLNHTGAHKINNSLGQALLCLRMGKKRIIAETGAG